MRALKHQHILSLRQGAGKAARFSTSGIEPVLTSGNGSNGKNIVSISSVAKRKTRNPISSVTTRLIAPIQSTKEWYLTK